MLKIVNFTKDYPGGKRAVDDISLTVRPGEICGFIGHNGAGKTTALRAAAGVLSFSQGDILIDGHSIKTDAIAAKRITAFLPDNPDLYEFMTGIKYLCFIGDLYGIPQASRKPLIENYAGAFGLTGVLGSAIGGYSHGMKQKLALVSAFIRKPKLLLLDEPFVGLDPTAAHLMKVFLHELCDQGSAVFFSTHVLEVAQRLCSRIAILREGKLVRVGDMEEVVGDSSLEDVFLELSGEGGAHDA